MVSESMSLAERSDSAESCLERRHGQNSHGWFRAGSKRRG